MRVNEFKGCNVGEKENKLPLEEVMKCIEIIKLARENQDEILVKELLLKYVDGYTSETI